MILPRQKIPALIMINKCSKIWLAVPCMFSFMFQVIALVVFYPPWFYYCRVMNNYKIIMKKILIFMLNVLPKPTKNRGVLTSSLLSTDPNFNCLQNFGLAKGSTDLLDSKYCKLFLQYSTVQFAIFLNTKSIPTYKCLIMKIYHGDRYQEEGYAPYCDDSCSVHRYLICNIWSGRLFIKHWLGGLWLKGLV
jgi:hypothetical protein